MDTILRSVLRYGPLGLGIAILLVGAAFVPWSQVLPLFMRLTIFDVALLTLLGISFYFSRIARYGYMLKILGTPMSLRKLIPAYFIAQPVSLLPGGEMYRSVLLKKHGKVPLANGIPVVFIQSLTENIGLILIALVCTIVVHKYVLVVLAVTVLYIGIVTAIQYRKSGHKRHKLINKIPFVSVSRKKMMSFFTKNHILLSGKSLFVLLLSSFISSFFAIAAIFVAAKGMDINLSVIEAALTFTLPTILQNVTFLPGGIGVNEQGSVGVLLLFGISVPAAVAITLVIRFITLVLGVVIGVLVSGCRLIFRRT